LLTTARILGKTKLVSQLIRLNPDAPRFGLS
jgi:hypothetical protein